MTVEEQLKELLEKLDFVTSMRCSGARTRRIRLLRREINNIRYRQGQHPRHSLPNGHLKEDDEDEEEEEEEDDDDKDAKPNNGLSSSDKGGWWKSGNERCLNFLKLTMHLKSTFFFSMRPVVNKLTEHCPQVIEPGSPPRTNPNHPTVSSLVSRGPQSLVSHGCLTTPLSQCTLCLHLFYHSHGLTTLMATYRHVMSSHFWLQASPVTLSPCRGGQQSTSDLCQLIHKVLPCHRVAGVQLWEQSSLFTCLDKLLRSYLQNTWTAFGLLEWNSNHFPVWALHHHITLHTKWAVISNKCWVSEILIFSSHLPEDHKSTSPPTLEPTGPAPPPRQGDAPLDPPTLRPITGEPHSPSWPCKRLKMDSDFLDGATENINCIKAQERPSSLHSEGQAMANGLPELNTPPRPTMGGVGRRTSVLFKKAKNGAKLFRDNPSLNGKGLQDDNTSNTSTAPTSTASTPSLTPLSTPSKTPLKGPGPATLNDQWTPVKDMCSDSELERTPNPKLESGEQLYFLTLSSRLVHSSWEDGVKTPEISLSVGICLYFYSTSHLKLLYTWHKETKCAITAYELKHPRSSLSVIVVTEIRINMLSLSLHRCRLFCPTALGISAAVL